MGDDADVLLDGGVRRGSDIVRALALGAKACLVGRPWVYGLAVGGTAGVEAVLDLLRGELERTLILVGCSSVRELDESICGSRPVDRAASANSTGSFRLAAESQISPPDIVCLDN